MKIAPLILVVDDHELLRVGLRSMLQSMELGDAQIAEAGSLKEAIEIYEQNADSIRLVILDLNLPDSKGLSALQAFKQRFPRSRVVILSGSVDEAIAEEARVLGAEQFLHKAGDLRLIGKVLQALPTLEGRGESAEGQGIATKLGAASTGGVRLSRREIELLDLVLQGRSNQEIVYLTGLRMGTVKNYISGLLVVFDVSSRSKLISLFR